MEALTSFSPFLFSSQEKEKISFSLILAGEDLSLCLPFHLDFLGGFPGFFSVWTDNEPRAG